MEEYSPGLHPFIICISESLEKGDFGTSFFQEETQALLDIF
jgi:hypothetical protein